MYFLTTSNWWEPNTAGVVDIGDITAFFVLLTGFAGVLIGVSRWWMKLLKGVIRDELTVATAPIHPNSNGGLSLADVARRTTGLEAKVSEIHDQNTETHHLISSLLISVAAPSKSPPRPVRAAQKKKTEKS